MTFSPILLPSKSYYTRPSALRRTWASVVGQLAIESRKSEVMVHAVCLVEQMMKRPSRERESQVEELFRRHASCVLTYAMRRGATRAEAEDVLAETFVVVCRRLRDVPQDALPWLLAIARGILANQVRGQRRDAALLDKLSLLARSVGPSDPTLDSSVLLDNELRETLMNLPSKDREALLLVAWEGLTHAQAAHVLGLSRKGFTARISRARTRLVQHLEGVSDIDGLSG